MQDIHHILKTHWGYPKFRPMQEAIIRSALDGNDTLALLPTGGGKSICFQVPALAKEGICLVVSPLIALMKDQVYQLKKRDIPAEAIYSGMNKQEIDRILDNCVYGNIKFLYASPERLKTEIFQIRAGRMEVNLLAIDEAHCISQWGYDFRPPYLEIADFREKFLPDVPCIALTATATETVKSDIQEKLAFREGSQVFQKSFARDNLSYSVFYEENKENRLVDMLRKVPGTGIVYARNRKRTQQIARYLQQRNISADFYHAGLGAEERTRRQDDWVNGRTRVVVATNAFGMGIDKPDVRLVVHLDLADSLEAYYQEAGRAGRDEKMAYAAVLYNHADVEKLTKFIERSFPKASYIRKVYQALANYLKIAVGSGYLETYDFELEDFISTFELEGPATYYALKKMEENGLIELNEAFYNPSKLMFLMSKDKLYEYQVAHAKLDPYIKNLLRMLGGEVFNHYLPVQERYLAGKFKLRVQDITRLLKLLDEQEVIHYIPRNDKPSITFLTERITAERLPLDVQFMENRKKHYLEKANAVIQYIKKSDECRTKQLLAYFGEYTDQLCGVCDRCIQMKKEEKFKKKQGPSLEELVLQHLSQEPITLPDLASKIVIAGKQQIIEAVRNLVSSGEVEQTSAGEFSKKNE